METLHHQQLHSEEVQDILLDAPKWLTHYFILGVLIYISILVVICFYIEYPESGEIKVAITETDSITRSRLKMNANFDSVFFGRSSLSQSVYGKISDRAVVSLQFPLYPVEKFGSLKGIVIKSQSDNIDSLGQVETVVAIQHSNAGSIEDKIRFKSGMQGEGTIVFSSENIISRILK